MRRFLNRNDGVFSLQHRASTVAHEDVRLVGVQKVNLDDRALRKNDWADSERVRRDGRNENATTLRSHNWATECERVGGRPGRRGYDQSVGPKRVQSGVVNVDVDCQ